MNFRIKLKNTEHSFDVEEGETILEGALRQNVDIPFSCQSGACSTCKGKVITGTFNYGGFAITGIDADNAQNEALFCCALPQSDMEISLEAEKIAYSSAQNLTAKILNKQPLGESIIQIRLQTTPTIHYRAGQYLELKTADKTYPLSIANAPENPYIEIHLQILPEQSYSKALLAYLNSQTEVQMHGPLGEAYLREDSDRPIILLAGGSGFAPIKAILERLFVINSKRAIHLYWGARAPQFLYYHDNIQKWTKLLTNLSYVPVISEPCSNWSGRTGLVHKAVLEDFPNLSSFEAYLAGPFAMSYAARDDFHEHGMPLDHIYSDAFAFENLKSS